MVQDARYTLPVLQQTWASCMGCRLGQDREARGEPVYFGGGTERGLLVIGTAPQKDNLRDGLFSTIPELALRKMLKRAGVDRAYYTYLVGCRSTAEQLDTEGRPREDRAGNRIINDAKPPQSCIDVCMQRIHQIIYTVDPVLIVALGSTVSEALLGRSVPMGAAGTLEPMMPGGKDTVMKVPARGHFPVKDAKFHWSHRHNGVWGLPTEQGFVYYPVMPSVDPQFVYDRKDDRSQGSPRDMFVRSIDRAVAYYKQHEHMVHHGVSGLLQVQDTGEFFDAEDQ